jgi:hypothetical protein
MSKRYMIFVDEDQLRVLVEEVKVSLTKAVEAQKTEMIIPMAGLVNQLRHPKELRDKPKSVWVQVKEQVFGK